MTVPIPFVSLQQATNDERKHKLGSRETAMTGKIMAKLWGRWLRLYPGWRGDTPCLTKIPNLFSFISQIPLVAYNYSRILPSGSGFPQPRGCGFSYGNDSVRDLGNPNSRKITLSYLKGK